MILVTATGIVPCRVQGYEIYYIHYAVLDYHVAYYYAGET